MGTEEVMRKTLLLAQSQLANYKTVVSFKATAQTTHKAHKTKDSDAKKRVTVAEKATA